MVRRPSKGLNVKVLDIIFLNCDVIAYVCICLLAVAGTYVHNDSRYMWRQLAQLPCDYWWIHTYVYMYLCDGLLCGVLMNQTPAVHPPVICSQINGWQMGEVWFTRLAVACVMSVVAGVVSLSASTYVCYCFPYTYDGTHDRQCLHLNCSCTVFLIKILCSFYIPFTSTSCCMLQGGSADNSQEPPVWREPLLHHHPRMEPEVWGGCSRRY